MPPILQALIDAGSGPIDFATDHAATDTDLAGVGADFAGGKALADEGQHAVADRLAGKAGSRCPEGDGGIVVPCCGQHRFEVIFRFDDGDDLRDQAVETGIGTVGETAQVIGDDLGCGQLLAQGADELTHGFVTPLSENYQQILGGDAIPRRHQHLRDSGIAFGRDRRFHLHRFD